MYYLCVDLNKTIKFDSAARFVTYSNQPHPKRNLNHFVLLLGYSGECPLVQDNREYILKKGTFQILFPNTLHYGSAPVSENQSHFWCHFYLPDGFSIEENVDYERQDGICYIPEFSQIYDCEKYYILFSQLIDEAEKFRSDRNTHNIICASYIRIILSSLAEQCNEIATKTDSRRARTAKICEWLTVHACKGITVSDAATALGYNPDYLTQLIKSRTGMSLCNYLNEIRLREAKNLLLNTNKTVSEVAYETGFSDEKYFMKLFKKREHATPTQYRNAHFRTHLNKL